MKICQTGQKPHATMGNREALYCEEPTLGKSNNDPGTMSTVLVLIQCLHV